MLELFLGFVEGISKPAVGIGIITGIGLLFTLVFSTCMMTEQEDSRDYKAGKTLKGFVKPAAFAFFCSIFICAIPTPDELFKIRLGLIKFQLANPENVEKLIKGGEKAIEEIGGNLGRVLRKLEGKYLPEEKEEKK